MVWPLVIQLNTLTPYEDDPSFEPKPFYTFELLSKIVEKANSQGYSVRMHAISDVSANLGLDIYEASLKANGQKDGIVNTLEHLDNVNPEGIPRFAELGVIPSMQPAHISLTESYFLETLGKKRAKEAYPHRALLDTGATLAFGSDNPCVSFNPFETIYYAVTRSSFDNKPLTMNPEQAITLEETLRAYTYGSACAVNADKTIGTLTPGKYADICVVDGPIVGEDIHDIAKRKAALTMSSGEVVYFDIPNSI